MEMRVLNNRVRRVKKLQGYLYSTAESIQRLQNPLFGIMRVYSLERLNACS